MVAKRQRDRRRKRSSNTLAALTNWLDSCRQGSVVEELVLFDLDGLCVASTTPSGDEVAANTAQISKRVQNYEGTIELGKQPANLRLRRFNTAGAELVLCALGGTGGEERARRVNRSIRGVDRILNSAA